jgi:hypothetical protein
VFLNKVADWQSGVPSFIDAMKAVFEPLYDLLKSQPMAFKIDDQIFHCPVKRAVTSKRRQLVSTPLSKEMHQDHRCSLISIDEAMAAGDRLHKNRRLARNPSMVSAIGPADSRFYRVKVPDAVEPPTLTQRPVVCVEGIGEPYPVGAPTSWQVVLVPLNKFGRLGR